MALEFNRLALSVWSLIIGIKYGYWNVFDSHVVGLRPGRLTHSAPAKKTCKSNTFQYPNLIPITATTIMLTCKAKRQILQTLPVYKY